MDKHDLLKESIGRRVEISNEAFDRFLACGKERVYRKGQFIVPAGSIARRTHFIRKGAAIAYCIDVRGHEHVIQFAVEGWWISDLHSYTSGEPALLSVQAIEDCELYEFAFDDLQRIFGDEPAFERYFLQITQSAFARFQERVLQNFSLEAEERYLRFVADYPQVNRRFAQKLVASYLGITPEFLSKLKKRLLEEKRG